MVAPLIKSRTGPSQPDLGGKKRRRETDEARKGRKKKGRSVLPLTQKIKNKYFLIDDLTQMHFNKMMRLSARLHLQHICVTIHLS